MASCSTKGGCRSAKVETYWFSASRPAAIPSLRIPSPIGCPSIPAARSAQLTKIRTGGERPLEPFQTVDASTAGNFINWSNIGRDRVSSRLEQLGGDHRQSHESGDGGVADQRPPAPPPELVAARVLPPPREKRGDQRDHKRDPLPRQEQLDPVPGAGHAIGAVGHHVG